MWLIFLLSQVPPADVTVGTILQLSQASTVVVLIVVSWWLLNESRKERTECRAHNKAVAAAHNTSIQEIVNTHCENIKGLHDESRAFIRELSDKCHDTHRESTAAVRKSIDISARAAYIIERFAAEHHIQPGKSPGPSDSVILKHLEGYRDEPPK